MTDRDAGELYVLLLQLELSSLESKLRACVWGELRPKFCQLGVTDKDSGADALAAFCCKRSFKLGSNLEPKIPCLCMMETPTRMMKLMTSSFCQFKSDRQEHRRAGALGALAPNLVQAWYRAATVGGDWSSVFRILHACGRWELGIASMDSLFCS